MCMVFLLDLEVAGGGRDRLDVFHIAPEPFSIDEVFRARVRGPRPRCGDFLCCGFNCLDGTFHLGARNVMQAVLDVTPGIGCRAMGEELPIARGT